QSRPGWGREKRKVVGLHEAFRERKLGCWTCAACRWSIRISWPILETSAIGRVGDRVGDWGL
ncbi:hypothetical protein, partial [Streptococcus dysgalactiae]|uniref:hypothetical protein n=1 Tax=Streptococcus dysgalactiae TaxID=1334 RepID=UPI00194EB9D1